MRKTTKALLASAFVFPGTGQLVYKKYLSASIFAGIALLATGVIVAHIVSVANAVVARVLSGEVSSDLLQIRELVTEQQANTQDHSVQVAIWVLVGVWIFSIIDAYRLGNVSADT